MKNRFQVKNFYTTTLTSVHTLSVGINGTLPVFTAPAIEDGKEFFIILSPLIDNDRQVIRCYMDGTSVKYYGWSVQFNKTYGNGTTVSINDVAELFSEVYNSVDDFGSITVDSGLDIIVRGGLLKYNDIGQVTIDDTEITLANNTINYIVFDFTDGQIKSTTSTFGLTGVVLSQISTSGGSVSGIINKREMYLGQGYDDSLFEFVNGKLTTKSGVLKNNFLDLEDSPNSYVGQEGKFPVVNSAEDGLEFTNITNIYSYNYQNSAASNTRTINHGMGTKNIIVNAYDNSDNLLSITDIDFTDDNIIVLHFGSSVDGRATILSAGGTIGTALHQATHIKGGVDELEGDKLDIDYIPTNYTRTSTSGNIKHLSGHLEGINNKITSLQSKVFDAIVATSGGDYTTVGAAINAGKRNIFVKNGNYTETEWRFSSPVANLRVVGEGLVNITFNNTSATTNYIDVATPFLFIEGINFYVTLNTTVSNFIDINSSVRSGIINGCGLYITLSTEGDIVNSGHISFRGCRIETTNTNTTYLNTGGCSFYSCYIVSGYINTAGYDYDIIIGSDVDISGLIGTLKSMGSTIAISNEIDLSLNGCSALNIIGACVGTIQVLELSNSTINVDNADIQISARMVGCDINTTNGDIEFNGCSVSSCELETTNGAYTQTFSSEIVGNIIRNGTAFELHTDYNIVSSNRFVSKGYTFTVNSGSDYNIITSNAQIGTITDNGTGNVKANNN